MSKSIVIKMKKKTNTSNNNWNKDESKNNIDLIYDEKYILPDKFNNLGLLTDKLLDLEDHIYNYCKNNNYSKQILSLYESHLYYIIKGSEYLITSINDNTILIDNIKSMTLEELNPIRWKTQVTKSQEIKNIKNKVVTSDIYLCPKCNSKCSYIEKQVRSMDEGATVYIKCSHENCGYSWKMN